MDLTTILMMGAALSFNLIIIKIKIEHNRKTDAALDAGLLALIGVVFSSTITGLMIGTIASAIISLYLLAFPPKAFNMSYFD